MLPRFPVSNRATGPTPVSEGRGRTRRPQPPRPPWRPRSRCTPAPAQYTRAPIAEPSLRGTPTVLREGVSHAPLPVRLSRLQLKPNPFQLILLGGVCFPWPRWVARASFRPVKSSLSPVHALMGPTWADSPNGDLWTRRMATLRVYTWVRRRPDAADAARAVGR